MAARLLMSFLIWPLIQGSTALNEHSQHQAPQSPAHGDPGPTRCGEYSNQILANGRCKIIATLPHQDGHRCPDMFRCTDEVMYWLHENEERRQEILELRELVSELQEELRNHRHRLRLLEQPDEGHYNSTLMHRVHSLEVWASESSTLQHLQTSYIYDIQAQLRNLSQLVNGTSRNTPCPDPAALRALELPHSAAVQSVTVNDAAAFPLTETRSCQTDCSALYHNGISASGVYALLPSSGRIPTDVFCDMDTEGGGWTVIQRRQDGAVNFNRTWNEYKEGFGNVNGEFWLGNENIHRMTRGGGYSLRIDLEDWAGQHKYALYREFSIEDETNFYRLHVTGPSGTAEDSFSWYHNKRSFSTPESGNLCAEISHGGWWYHQCFYSNLNGVYYLGGRYVKGRRTKGPDGIVWYSWRNTDYYSLKRVSMMIRPRMFRSHISP